MSFYPYLSRLYELVNPNVGVYLSEQMRARFYMGTASELGYYQPCFRRIIAINLVSEQN